MAVSARVDTAKRLAECPECKLVAHYNRPFVCGSCGFSAHLRHDPASLDVAKANPPKKEKKSRPVKTFGVD